MSFSTGFLIGRTHQLARDAAIYKRNAEIHAANANLATRNAQNIYDSAKILSAELDEALELADRYAVSKSKFDVYFRGEAAKVDYLMSYLDQIAGGKHLNPMRDLAFPEDPTVVIPAGPRKGERMTWIDFVGHQVMIAKWKKDYMGVSEDYDEFLKLNFEMDR